MINITLNLARFNASPLKGNLLGSWTINSYHLWGAVPCQASWKTLRTSCLSPSSTPSRIRILFPKYIRNHEMPRPVCLGSELEEKSLGLNKACPTIIASHRTRAMPSGSAKSQHHQTLLLVCVQTLTSQKTLNPYLLIFQVSPRCSHLIQGQI